MDHRSAASLGYHMATETEPIQLVAEIKELDLAKEGDGSKPKATENGDKAAPEANANAGKVDEKGKEKGKSEAPLQEEEAKTKICDYCCETIPAKALRCRHCGSHLTKKTTEDSDAIQIIREETRDEGAGSFGEKLMRVWVVIKDDMIKQQLRCFMNDTPELLEKEPKLSAEELFTVLPTLRENSVGYIEKTENPLYPLINFLETEFEEQSKKFEALKAEGLVTFEFLRYLFVRGSQFYGTMDGEPIGSAVHDTYFARSMLGSFFVVQGEVIKSKGDSFFIAMHNFIIPQFRGARRIVDLNLRPMDEEVKKTLVERGKKFAEIATGTHFLEYDGPMIFKTRYYRTSWNAEGRIMVDGVSFNKMHPEYEEFNPNMNQTMRHYRRHGASEEEESIKSIPEDAYFKTWHTVGGFSYRTKKWGEIMVSKTRPVKFDDRAYERLVLPPEKKMLIQSLILNTNSSFADIISGKGSGCIFLLHGPPGTGKTLTAEAVAEFLHRPLYSISVGELGVDTNHLEAVLRDILDVASVWNAVILIDEADIFLEKRTDNDINRNALVGIFLRLLEYHQGIIFLTTNRVKRFDEAFHSRISVALKYPELDEEGRRKVWKILLEAAGINEPLDIARLAKEKLNGRQIRTTIRLAQSLSKAEKVPLTLDHFLRTISVATQFQHDLMEPVDLKKRAFIGGAVAAAVAGIAYFLLKGK